MANPQCITHERTFAVGDKKCFFVGGEAPSSKLNGVDLHEIFRPLHAKVFHNPLQLHVSKKSGNRRAILADFQFVVKSARIQLHHLRQPISEK